MANCNYSVKLSVVQFSVLLLFVYGMKVLLYCNFLTILIFCYNDVAIVNLVLYVNLH